MSQAIRAGAIGTNLVHDVCRQARREAFGQAVAQLQQEPRRQRPRCRDLAGAPRPLAAEPDTRVTAIPNRPGMLGRGTLQARPVPVMVDNQDRQAAVFQLGNARGNWTVASGFESKWLTAARRP